MYGTSDGLRPFATAASLPNGVLEQLGLKRKNPLPDLWSYGTPWYRFRYEVLDSEVRNFLTAHAGLGSMLASVAGNGLTHALFSLCPVAEQHDETFACILERETIAVLNESRLALEIAPEVSMLDYPFWIDQGS